jgi:23S rRNA (guanosine2251-2'-O)-methyltransferase
MGRNPRSKGERFHLHSSKGSAATSARGGAKSEDYLFDLLDKLDRAPFLLFLDEVQDPHNLGACMRSAAAAGVDAVIIPKDRSVGLTEVVRRVACGGTEEVPLIQVTNLARVIDQLKEKNIWFVGTTDKAEQSIYELDLTGPLALVMGAEGKGMRRLTQEKCDFLAMIPMSSTAVPCLNVSVATGVCLFEAVRQRGNS